MKTASSVSTRQSIFTCLPSRKKLSEWMGKEYFFLDVKGKEETNPQRSILNPVESRAVCSVMNSLMRVIKPGLSIVVLSFYSAQVSHIQNEVL